MQDQNSQFENYKNNISLWYDEMKDYGLTPAEMEVLKPHFRSLSIA